MKLLRKGESEMTDIRTTYVEELAKTRLDAQTILLLVVHGLFMSANALSGTFVHVYLWKVGQSLAIIGWFTFFQQFANAVTVWFAGKWVKERNKMNCLRLGVAVSGVFYLCVLFLREQAIDYVFLLGLIQGFAFGCFWLAFNVIYFEVTGPNTRDQFNGWSGFLTSMSSMIAPWISGFIITQMPDAQGYLFIFTISMTIFIVGFFVSFFLHKRKVTGVYQWKTGFNMLRKKGGSWRLAVPALIAQGVREGVFLFLISLLVYVVTKNEFLVGNYSLITSAVALVSFWIAGKILRPKKRDLLMLLGSIMMILAILPFFWQVNYFTLLLFGIVTAIFFPFYSIPMISSVFDIIGQDDASARHHVEYIVLRETGLTFGRMTGVLMFVITVTWSDHQQMLNAMLLLIGSTPILAWFFMRKLLRV